MRRDGTGASSRPERWPVNVAAVLLDVDGTLVDSNDVHARAWVAAFAEHGVGVDHSDVRRCIGMGGDKLMPVVSGIDEGSPLGSSISTRRGEIYCSLLAHRTGSPSPAA
jgi:beta-phosphoglucomutase-like phosphatase (HAD superfamily)